MICPVHKDEDLVCAVAVRLEENFLRDQIEKLQKTIQNLKTEKLTIRNIYAKDSDGALRDMQILSIHSTPDGIVVNIRR